jgi:transcriptional regulator GlxA family with amidase domain
MPPASYLAQVRLDAATGLLRDTALSVTLIAANVGYTSEAAFSRAFKRRYGTPPARWRRDSGQDFRPRPGSRGRCTILGCH